MTVAALLTLLDEIDTQGGPEAARNGTLRLPATWKGPAPMAQPVPQLSSVDQPRRPTPVADTAVPVGQLLKWGDDHPDREVQDQAARARLALTGLRRRHAADQELTAITSEREQLQQRLAELEAREQELAPAKPKKKRAAVTLDYDTREVRAWADANGVDCPRVGRIPRLVVDAWRAAQTRANGDGDGE